MVSEVYPQLTHGADDGHEALDCVAVHHRPVLLEVLRREAALVDDLHLLHDRRLPGLSGACDVSSAYLLTFFINDDLTVVSREVWRLL